MVRIWTSFSGGLELAELLDGTRKNTDDLDVQGLVRLRVPILVAASAVSDLKDLLRPRQQGNAFDPLPAGLVDVRLLRHRFFRHGTPPQRLRCRTLRRPQPGV